MSFPFPLTSTLTLTLGSSILENTESPRLKMGCLGVFNKLFGVVIVLCIGVLLGPNTLPSNVKFTEFYVTPVKNFGYEPNQLLDNAERLFENEIKGPEAFEIVNGELFTTLHGGFVVKVFEDQVIPVVKFGEPCAGWWEERKCGRPLGMKLVGNDLIITDAYYGVIKYNLKTEKKTTLIDKEIDIDGRKPKIFMSVDVAKDGSIYFTHSSSDFLLEDGIFTLLADGSGRLLKYDPETKKISALIRDLYFPNGLILSPNEDFILVAESGHSRILRFHLKGPKKFTSDIFLDGLPGIPDNLRSNGAGGLFVPLVCARNEHTPALFQTISSFPTLRKFLARLMSVIEVLVDKINRIIPSYYAQWVLHYIGHFESASPFLPVNATLLEVDWDGNIIRNYHGSDGSITSISDVIVHNGYLYLGSPYNNYLGRIKLSNLGGQHEIQNPNPSTITTQTQSTIPPTPSTTRPTASIATTRPKTTPPRTTPTPTTNPPPRTTKATTCNPAKATTPPPTTYTTTSKTIPPSSTNPATSKPTQKSEPSKPVANAPNKVTQPSISHNKNANEGQRSSEPKS